MEEGSQWGRREVRPGREDGAMVGGPGGGAPWAGTAPCGSSQGFLGDEGLGPASRAAQHRPVHPEGSAEDGPALPGRVSPAPV